MSVYVAGSSSEIERARRVMDRYRAAGVEVTSTWPDAVAAAGSGNPRDASRDERGGYAHADLAQVSSADVLHVLIPDGPPSFGAGVEFGFALSLGRQLIASGDTLRSVFTAIGRERATDDEAIAQVIAAHERAGKIIPGTPIDAWGKVIVRSPHARPNPPDPSDDVMRVFVIEGEEAKDAIRSYYQGLAAAHQPAHVEPERSTAMRAATDEEGDGGR